MAQDIPTLTADDVFESRYTVVKKLGAGAFGGVYLVKDRWNNDRLCALKVEGANEDIQLLKMEVYVMETLVATNSNRHFATILAKGRTPMCNYIVMTLLGPSLDKHVEKLPGNKYTMSTALRVGILCLEALQDMHNIGFLHRDIKPANFASGNADAGEQRKIYVLDFGMCRTYISPRTGKHITPRRQVAFRGTVRYAAVKSHMFQETSRRDDCEAWFYQQVELTSGRLPWSSLTDRNQIGDYKKLVRQQHLKKDLLAGCPRAYVDIMDIIDKLEYADKPPYSQIYMIMRDTMAKLGAKDSDPFDWEQQAGGSGAGTVGW